MAVVRSPILTEGFYWFDDVQLPNRKTNFLEWVGKQKGLVVVRKTVDHPDQKPKRAWFLFEVKFPAVWDQRLGFPNTATATTEEKDTASDAAQPGGGNSGPGLFDGLALLSTLADAMPLLILGGIAWYVSDNKR
jgi:hypothetical protein